MAEVETETVSNPVHGHGPIFPTRKMNTKEKRYSRRIAQSIAKRREDLRTMNDDDILVNLDGYGNLHVACRAGLLKPPFGSAPIVIYSYLKASARVTDEVLWDTYGSIIAELMTRPARMCDVMRAVVDEIESAIAGTGMRLLRYRPTEVRNDAISVMADIRMIDLNLDEQEAIFHVSGPGNRTSRSNIGELKREARAQAERITRREEGYIVDTVLNAALGTMTDRGLRRLESFIREEAGRDRGYIQEYRHKELIDRGISVPEAIETLKIKNGIITGRVRLSENATFNRNRLLISRHLPSALIHRIRESKIGEIVEHPWVGADIAVTDCKTHEADRTAISIDVPMVHFPSGIPVPDKRK